MGCGFDVATNGEIDIIKGHIDPKTCIHTHPIKKISSIEYALDFGIDIFVADNELELDKFVPFKDRIKLLLRVSTPNEEVKTNLSAKFGANFEDMEEMLRKAKELGLHVMGFCFHVGSQTLKNQKFSKEIGLVYSLFEVAKSYGHNPDRMDIGGGFPWNYETGEMDIVSFCEPIREALAPILA